MAFRIADWFGYDADYRSPQSNEERDQHRCPFIESTCTKKLRDSTVSGVCSAFVGRGATESPVIICPNRLYADTYSILQDTAAQAFGGNPTVITPDQLTTVEHDGTYVVAFGQRYGRELRLPARGIGRNFSIDWVLARISPHGVLAEFSALEVQSIDTTGNYHRQLADLQAGRGPESKVTANLNWENVNKRILPQLIYKGHALRREELCPKGLFFACPGIVYQHLLDRLGGTLEEYTPHRGSITFLRYGLGLPVEGMRPLLFEGASTTTVDQVALAFTAPRNLPPAGAYENAIRAALGT